jgi:hypothetical protein
LPGGGGVDLESTAFGLLGGGGTGGEMVGGSVVSPARRSRETPVVLDQACHPAFTTRYRIDVTVCLQALVCYGFGVRKSSGEWDSRDREFAAFVSPGLKLELLEP